jgi:two-component sensor histidine kinase
MSAKFYHIKINFKAFLFILGLLIVLGVLIYTQQIVNQLQESVREHLNFHAKLYAQIITSESDEQLNFLFDEVIERADFPIIYSDANGTPSAWKNIDISTFDRSPETLEKVKQLIKNLDEEIEPIPLEYQGQILGYFHYGESELIRKLRWLPFIEIAVGGIFILIGYIGFSTIKRSEQRFIWVGMAKETAHQLGTPISSLMGWLEMLSDKCQQNEVIKIVREMKNDVQRLSKVAARFSQIGSKTDLKNQNIIDVLSNTVEYFRNRLPKHTDEKRIEIVENYQDIGNIPLNKDLFEWVIENLVKNSLDAIGDKNGRIEIKLYQDGKLIYIDIKDNGKGIELKDRNDIFKPGFSTKKRGWGLGLSLAKRIVEEYHNGKLVLAETQVGVGTTMRIILQK